MLVLNRREVEALLDPDELIDAVAAALADLSAGRASMPARNFAHVKEAGGILAAMPAYVPASGALAAKLVLVFHGNSARGLDTHQALVAVFDPDTGQPAAVMDGASITALRTAAGSALATRLCAPEAPKVLAIIGSGVQARSHARIVTRVRRFERIVVAGRTPDRVRVFSEEIGARAASSYEEAVSAADVVCSCTNATEPVVLAEWLRPGAHLNAVGFAAGPEVDPAVFADAAVVVESRDAVVGTFPHGAADLTAAIERGLLRREDLIEIGDLVDGRRSVGNRSGQRTVYRSVGVAVQDAAAAMCVLRAARRRNVGTEVQM